MRSRNRATGWKYAKLSGHTNETYVKKLLDEDNHYAKEFMERINCSDDSISSTSIGGLHETNVLGVLGNKTKSKTDLKVKCTSGKEIRISIKKSLGGQVYFVRAALFIDVFEKQFHKPIPKNVQRAIRLFWAAADDALAIIEAHGDKTDNKSFKLQYRHKSLNATTLKNYDKSLYGALLNWFSDNISDLTKLSFTMGAAKDASEWSDYVWYINLVKEDNVVVDEIFYIEDICKAAKKFAKTETFYGESNGGTTIQLPFGFVQWHQGQLQFHHSYEKVCNLIKRL